MAVVIAGVEPKSYAARAGVRAGDRLKEINGHAIQDVLDYRFYGNESKLRLTLDRQGKRRFATVRKPEDADLGLIFDTYLMDGQKSCRNKCMFCFIDQLPPGLRDSLYFKDDDSRLSFLFGNYITLTNLTERDVERILEMHISPVNVSVHTTDPELRVRMMKNKDAGRALELLQRFAGHGIRLNCQLVLCPGVNDGAALSRSLEDLIALYPSVQSIAAVPVGLTRYREGLCEIKGYTRDGARDVVARIERVGDACLRRHGVRIAYASDEFYRKAELPIPEAEFYGEFAQLENGVGMWALLREEFLQAVNDAPADTRARRVSVATGEAAFPLLREMVDIARAKWHNLTCSVYAVQNEFFGPSINVAGLLTGRDLIAQLTGKPLGDSLLLSASMFRREGDLMLDDTTPQMLEQALGVPVTLVPNDGAALLAALLGR